MVATPDGPRRTLKNLFQEAGIPPFLRRILPRVRLRDELIAVPLLAESAAYRACDREVGIHFELVPAEAHADIDRESIKCRED
jgi:hypothetical protein